MSILVLGYFGFVTNQIDGQTIRTRSLNALLESKSVEDVVSFDTQSFKESKLKFIKCLREVAKADAVLYVAAHKNLTYLFPIIFVVALLNNTKLNYVAVGGWLFEFLKNKPIHRFLLSKINSVCVQTKNLYMDLQRYGLQNVRVLNNFRMIDYPQLTEKSYTDRPLRLVFMARIHPLKGVNVLFKLDSALEAAGVTDVSIHLYGPIYKAYENEFFEQLAESRLEYLGVVEPSDIYDVIQEYDLMLFPTKYYTEGFPGTILDSYISGVPVVASDWLNATEFIEEGKTGYIVEFDNDQQFIDKVVEIVQCPNELSSLRRCIRSKRDDYSPGAAWEVLDTELS